MKKLIEPVRANQKPTRMQEAVARAVEAEKRTEQAETRAEQAESRAEQAETRRAEAETALQNQAHSDVDLPRRTTVRELDDITHDGVAGQVNALDSLTIRQREVLRLIAEGQNTKQMGEILKVSPKTVEYHRMKLMNCLNVHDVARLVRLALRTGLVPLDGEPALRAALP